MISTAAKQRAGRGGATLRARRADLLAVLALVIVTAVALRGALSGGTAIGMDAAAFFYPMYTYLGETLRSGHLPVWNPYHLGGAPSAADPQSGWTYWPAMLLFTLLSPDAAATCYLIFHLLGAALAMYALARVLGLDVPGALVAAVAYELTGFTYERNLCCFAATGVETWLPLALLGAELAIRSRGRLLRGVWWGVAGLALSQVLAQWLGQGAYYALLVTGGYVAYRTLLAPPEVSGVRSRVGALLLHGSMVLLFAFGLAAAGVLPRLEFNALSNLAGGYPQGLQASLLGPAQGVVGNLLWRGTWYAGGATLVLAAAGLFAAGRRFAAPYWTAVALGSMLLTRADPTPLHRLLYLLPGFERLHPHNPERIVMLLYLSAALLAGSTVSSAWRRGSRARLLALLPGVPILALPAAYALQQRTLLSPRTVVAAGLAVAFIAAAARRTSRSSVLSALMLFVVFLDLFANTQGILRAGAATREPWALPKTSLSEYYRPGGAGQFLRGRGAGPFRYFGYDPSILSRGVPYRYMFAYPDVAALLVNNRSIVLRLQDIQGYNPVHIRRYDEYMAALNGAGKEYRALNVGERGVHSPLLDLLNVRYIVTPSGGAAAPPPGSSVRPVYADSQVRVLERRGALPRAWLVHSAQQVEEGGALPLLASGQVDPRRTVLLEKPPPPLAPPTDPRAEQARITEYDQRRLRVRVRATAPAMLVLGEVYYPAWKAYVDGRPAELYAADHALRAVPVPEGEHTVELRYESATLTAGLAISALFYAALAALGAAACWRRFRGAPAEGRFASGASAADAALDPDR